MKVISESWHDHIEPSTKQQAAYNILKTAIVSLDLPPNTVLVERYILERFELSRTPMREAINRLYIEGFVSNFGGKGFIVNDIQLRDFMDMYEVKEALESEAAAICCSRKIPSVIARIEEAYKEYESYCNKKLYITSLMKDLDFHWAIVKGAENPYLEKEMSIIMDKTLKFFNIYYREEVPERINTIYLAQHTKMLEAIKGNDPKAAREAVLEHSENVKFDARNDLFMK
ncbi:MAG: GntR family transcriptional regulator [Clostridiales bacterium]|nr:GntR family transcriptional regulator [Clostridiales bacterium]